MPGPRWWGLPSRPIPTGFFLVNAWPEVVGPSIAAYTDGLFVRNQTLYVHLTSAVLRQELMMGRTLLVRNLNKHVGAQVITDIVFR